MRPRIALLRLDVTTSKSHRSFKFTGHRRDDANVGGFRLIGNCGLFAIHRGVPQAESWRQLDGNHVRNTANYRAIAGECIALGFPAFIGRAGGILRNVTRRGYRAQMRPDFTDGEDGQLGDAVA